MELVSIEDNNNNMVVKHQELVRNARYRLGDTALKTLSLLISMIKVSDTEFTQYSIKLSDFKELTGANSKEVFKYVDKMTNDLMSNPFWIGNVKLNWVSMAEYREGEGLVVFEIHRYLKPYLLALNSHFLQYNVINILPLKSGYVIRLYELCKDHFAEAVRYKPSLKSVVFDMKIERLIELFEIPKSYQYSSHIKKHILDKAVEQFKEKTDIQISYTEQKIGRKVDRIIITVKSNNKGSNDYLQHRQAFISYMRNNYVNADVLEAQDKNTGKIMMVSIAPDGKLYDKKGSEFDKDRSNEMWDTLFDMAKNDKLYCLKQGNLFILEDTPTIETTVFKSESILAKKQPDDRIELGKLAFKDIYDVGELFDIDDRNLEEEFRFFKNQQLSKYSPTTKRKWKPLLANWILKGGKFEKSMHYKMDIEYENHPEDFE